MDTLVVQSGVKQGRIAEVTRSDGDTLCIGRGYDNDLVLTDPHIAPRQLEFFREDEQWYLRALDHTNPVMLNDKAVGADPVPVHSGDKLAVGRTRLALYAADHEVEPTRKLVLSSWVERYSGTFLTPILFLVGACLFDMALTYYEGSTDLIWEDYAYGALFLGVMILAWSGLWSLIGRIIRHQHQFGLHLMAGAASLLLISVLTVLGSYLVYSLHNLLVSELLDWLIAFIALAALIRLNLLLATHINNILAVAAVFSALTLAVTYGFTVFGESDEFQYEPEYSSSLKPPAFNVIGGETLDDYFSAVAAELAEFDQ